MSGKKIASWNQKLFLSYEDTDFRIFWRQYFIKIMFGIV